MSINFQTGNKPFWQAEPAWLRLMRKLPELVIMAVMVLLALLGAVKLIVLLVSWLISSFSLWKKRRHWWKW